MNVPFMHFQDVNLKICACFPKKPDPSREALSGMSKAFCIFSLLITVKLT